MSETRQESVFIQQPEDGNIPCRVSALNALLPKWESPILYLVFVLPFLDHIPS